MLTCWLSIVIMTMDLIDDTKQLEYNIFLKNNDMI